MSLFGRSLALLKELNITLNEDLADIDLMALKAATGSLDSNALARWVRLLEAVSPPLVMMGKDVTSAEAFVERRRSSTRTMQKMMCTMGAALTIIISLSTWQMMSVSSLPQKTLGVGLLLCCLLGFFALIKTWIVMLVERLDRYDAQNDSPVMNVLRKYRITLSDKFIVQYSAAYTTGRNMKGLMDRISPDDDADNANSSDASQQPGRCGRNNSTYNGETCELPVDPCTPTDLLPPLDDVVKRYCKPIMTDMLDRLQEIKDDVTQYDRILLLNDVDSGINELRKLVYLQYDIQGVVDSSSDGGGVTRTAAMRVMDDEIIPILKQPTIDLSIFRASNPSMTGTQQKSKNACWRSCTDDVTCMVATYDETTKMCVKSDAYAGGIEGGGLSFVTKPKKATPVLVRQPANDNNKPLFVCGKPLPDATDRMKMMPPSKTGTNLIEACRADPTCKIVSDGHMWRAAPDSSLQMFLEDTPLQQTTQLPVVSALAQAAAAISDASTKNTCVKTTPEELYNDAMQTNAVSRMRDDASGIAQDLVTVLQKHAYQFSLDANRAYIDSRLIEHYGPELYNKLSKVVDEIMLRVRVLIQSVTSSRNAKYVADTRLAAKVGEATGEEWTLLTTKMQRTLVAVKQHRDNFPTYRNNLPTRMFKSLTLYGTFIAGIAYLVFMVLIFHAKRIMAIDGVTMIRRIMVSLCVFILTIVIAETCAKKYAVTREHNFDAIDNNGETLVGGVSRVIKQLNVLREAALREKATVPGSTGGEVKRLSSPTLRDVRGAIESYDRCNFITTSVSKMPFPTVDLALFVIVGVLFIGVAGFAIARIGPAERIENIRRLLSAKSRLKRGEITNMTEVVRLVECCQPPDMVWDMFVWFAIIMLFIITWWFVFSTRDTVDDYESAIAANPDCV